MKKLLLVISICFFSYTNAQIGIGTDTPDTSSILDISSSGGSGVALDITPKSLSINTFIYLGN